MAKTPAMILQELTVHHGLPPPEYNVVHSDAGTHNNEFHIGVDVGKIYVIGIGPSKKIAKHDAAHKALEALALKGVLPKDSEVHSPIKRTVNCIMTLRDLCNENKLPDPEFIFVSDIGQPHCREFTYKCKLGSMLTQATEGSKKQSKQVAAQKMLDKIANILPELVEEYNNSKMQIDELHNTAIKKYIELTPNEVKRNFTIPVAEYDETLSKLMKFKKIELKDFENWFDSGTEENIQKILEKLDLTFDIINLQETPSIVGIDVSTETPITALAVGISAEDAKEKAFAELHNLLKIFLDYN